MTDLTKLSHNPMYRYLIALTIASSVGLQTWRTLFDNFAVNVVGLDGGHIGMLQSIREIPGFLALLVVFVMLVLREHKISALSVITLGIGVLVTGLFPSYAGLIGTTLIMSLGFHYAETTFQSLTLQYFDQKTSPLVFGKLRSVGAGANVVIGIVIFILASVLSYQNIYLALGCVVAMIGFWGLTRNPTRTGTVPQHKKMIIRSRYWLFYFLTFMAGARRQIFVAFAVFLLVSRFDFSVQEITALFVVNNIINYFLAPLIGRAIVRFGERKVLSAEYFSLIFIFLAYTVADSKLIVAMLYVADHIFFNFAIAIRTFFQKISDPHDIAPSMAVGFTINHIGAVVFPVIGGLLWMVDYRIPFVIGSGFALISLVAVQLIPSQVKRANVAVGSSVV